jgi:hypothetical protein
MSNITLPEAHQKFRSFFPGLRFNDFMDPALTLCTGEPKIDLCKLDDYLHEQHGDYEVHDINMADVLAEKYGKDANTFIEGLI